MIGNLSLILLSVIVWSLANFVSTLFHEFSHKLVAERLEIPFKIDLRWSYLWGSGKSYRVDGLFKNLESSKKVKILIAGPISELISILILFALSLFLISENKVLIFVSIGLIVAAFHRLATLILSVIHKRGDINRIIGSSRIP